MLFIQIFIPISYQYTNIYPYILYSSTNLLFYKMPTKNK